MKNPIRLSENLKIFSKERRKRRIEGNEEEWDQIWKNPVFHFFLLNNLLIFVHVQYKNIKTILYERSCSIHNVTTFTFIP